MIAGPSGKSGTAGFPPARRIGAAKFGWHLAEEMRWQQPRLYYSSVAAALVIAALQIIDWRRFPDGFLHISLTDQLSFAALNLLRLLLLTPVAYAAFRRLYLDDRQDSWLWRAKGWRDKRFIGLFLGITCANLIPSLLAGPARDYNPWGQVGIAVTGIAILILYVLVCYYTTKAQFLAPALATDDGDCTLQTALQRSRGHFWNLMIGQICVILPLIILNGLCFFLLYPLMKYLAGLGYVPLLRPIAYVTAYGYLTWGLFGTSVFIAEMAVVAAFYQRREQIADIF